jgi:DNA-binding MarR family transcriptional regulator
MAQSTPEIADSLIFLTNRVGRLLSNEVRKRLEQEEDVQDLQPHHISILVDLWLQDGVRQQDLAVSTIKDKATITRILDFLERQNLVVRVTDRVDKRNKRIYLTYEGKKMKHQLVPHAESVVHEAGKGISEEELNICRKVLVRVYNNLIK